jgi:hypothetical protein
MLRTHRYRGRAVAVAFGFVLAAGLAGCGGAASNKSSSAGPVPAEKAPPAAADGAQQQPNQALPNGGGAANGGNAQVPAKLVPNDRSVVYTGTIAVRVSNVDEAANRAEAIATGASGFVGGDKRNINDGHSDAQIILRVPANRFSDVVTQLSKLGKEESRAITAEDVTDQVVDVDSRITTQQASVDRVRALLAKAQTISDIVSLESELSRRESDLESLKARKTRLDDLTALSTITLSLLGPDTSAQPPTAKKATGFVAGLKAGWHAFLASLQVMLTILGALLPWLVVLGLPVLVALWLVRRVRVRAPRVPVEEPPTAQ